MPYKDPEKRKAMAKATNLRWREKNKDRWRGYKRTWTAENNGRINSQRRWRYLNDPEYRLRVEKSIRSKRWKVSADEMEAFLALYEEDCFYCGGKGGTVDHLTPRSRGGEDRLYNLVPCCKSCNSSKNSRILGEWYDAAGSTL